MRVMPIERRARVAHLGETSPAPLVHDGPRRDRRSVAPIGPRPLQGDDGAAGMRREVGVHLLVEAARAQALRLSERAHVLPAEPLFEGEVNPVDEIHGGGIGQHGLRMASLDRLSPP